jgi:predicted glycoside hydrolase/deacetylase ChbG (UPF0249 family)
MRPKCFRRLPVKTLIVNADDFGISLTVNAAIVEAYRDGILRYASLMVKGEAVSDAVKKAKENPGLGVGLHLELCRDHPEAWGLRYFFNPSDRARIRPEIVSQIEKFLSFGLKPTHVDGHFNINAHPVIYPILAQEARRYGIPRLRLPRGELGEVLAYEKTHRVPRFALAATFGVMAYLLKSKARGLTVPDRTYGLLRSGMMNEKYMEWLIRRLPEGLTELYCHPSTDTDSAVTHRPTPTHHTVTELRALTSPRVKAALQESGVVLASEA